MSNRALAFRIVLGIPAALLLVVFLFATAVSTPSAPAGRSASTAGAGDDEGKSGKKERDKDKPSEDEKKGKLGEFEGDVSKRKSGAAEHHDGEDGVSQFLADVMWQIGPKLAFGLRDSSECFDSSGRPIPFLTTGFSIYPYAGIGGLYTRQSDRAVSAHVQAGMFHESGSLNGLLISARVAPHQLVGLELQYARFREDLRPLHANLDITNFFVNYHRVRQETWALWWGLGAKRVQGEGTHYGPALNIGTEIYPQRPVSLAAGYNVGFMPGAAVPEFGIALRVHLGPVVPFAGYRSWSTGSTALRGMTAGVGAYF